MEVVDEVPSTSSMLSSKKKTKRKKKVIAVRCTKHSFNKSLSYHSISQLKYRSAKYKKQIEHLSNTNKELARALAETQVNLTDKNKIISELQKTNSELLFVKARMKEIGLTLKTLIGQLCELENFIGFDSMSSLTSNILKSSENNSSGANENLSESMQLNSSYLIKELANFNKNFTDASTSKLTLSNNANDDKNRNVMCNMSIIDEISLNLDDELPPIICLEDEEENEKVETREEKRSHSNKNTNSLGDHTPPSPELHFKSFSNMKLRRSFKHDKIPPSKTMQTDVLDTQNDMPKLSINQEPFASKIPLKLKTSSQSVNSQLETKKITKHRKQSSSRKSKPKLNDNIDLEMEEIDINKTQIRRTTFVVNSNQNKTGLNIQTKLDDDIIALNSNSLNTFNTRRGTYVITNNLNKKSKASLHIEQENESNHQIDLNEHNANKDIPSVSPKLETHPLSPKFKLSDHKVEASLPPPTKICSNIALELPDDMELTECINHIPITQESATINTKSNEQEHSLLENNSSNHLLNINNNNTSVMTNSPKVNILNNEEIISENKGCNSSQDGNEITDFNDDLINFEVQTKPQKRRENSKSSSKITKRKTNSNAHSTQRKLKSDANKKSSSQLDKKINKTPKLSNAKKLSEKNTIVVNAEIHHHCTPIKPDFELDYQSPLLQPSLVLVDCFDTNTDRELLSNALKNHKQKADLNKKTSSDAKNNLKSKLIDNENIESTQIKEVEIPEDVSSLVNTNGTRRKRSKHISYKEPSLNVKLRRT